MEKLTQLTYLRRENSPGLTSAGLQWLTALWLLQTVCLEGNDGLNVISAAFYYEEDNIKYQQLQLEAGSKVRHKDWPNCGVTSGLNRQQCLLLCVVDCVRLMQSMPAHRQGLRVGPVLRVMRTRLAVIMPVGG